MKYQILVTDSSKGLQEVVNEQIAEGWEPLGGASYAVCTYKGQWDDETFDHTYTQAMIKRGDK